MKKWIILGLVLPQISPNATAGWWPFGSSDPSISPQEASSPKAGGEKYFDAKEEFSQIRENKNPVGGNKKEDKKGVVNDAELAKQSSQVRETPGSSKWHSLLGYLPNLSTLSKVAVGGALFASGTLVGHHYSQAPLENEFTFGGRATPSLDQICESYVDKHSCDKCFGSADNMLTYGEHLLGSAQGIAGEYWNSLGNYFGGSGEEPPRLGSPEEDQG